MRIIISPAKKMVVDTDNFAPLSAPQFLPQTRQLLSALEAMSPKDLQALWNCNDAIARRSLEQLAQARLDRRRTPALMAYRGIQYQYMAPGVLEERQLAYLQEHLRILSGFYGILRPFDGVVPYRLEMQAPLALDGHRDLYDFWGDRLGAQLGQETQLVVNLASREYGRAVEPHLPPTVTFLTCVFGEAVGDRVVEKGTLCKMARGEMVRWMAQAQVTQAEELRNFSALGYRYAPERSGPTRCVFLREAGPSARR